MQAPFLESVARGNPVLPQVAYPKHDFSEARRELVAIAAHPLNQPRIEPGTRFISRGYGILQPRIATPMPTTATAASSAA